MRCLVSQAQRLGFALCGLGEAPEVDEGQAQAQAGSDDLHRAIRVTVEGGAQSFVTLHDLLQAVVEGGEAESTMQAQSGGDVVAGAARSQLFQEPEALLGEGEVVGVSGAAANRNGEQGAVAAGAGQLDQALLELARLSQVLEQAVGQFGDRRGLEEEAQSHLLLQELPQASDHLGCQQGVAA